MNNLQAEVCGGNVAGPVVKHLKTYKIATFLIKNVLLCQDDAIRCNETSRILITESLIKFLVSKTIKKQLIQNSAIHINSSEIAQNGTNELTFFDNLLKQMVSRLSDSSKQQKNQKVMKEYRNSLLVDLSQDLERKLPRNNDENQSDDYGDEDDEDDDDFFARLTPSTFKQLHLYDLLSNSKFMQNMSNITHLMTNFEPLLREDTSTSRNFNQFSGPQKVRKNKKKGQQEDAQNVALTREEQLKELDRITGKMYKLSDFIDPEFLEQCLAQPVTAMASADGNDEAKRPVSEFVQELESASSGNWLFQEMERSFGNKRQRTEEDGRGQGEPEKQFLLLSPILAVTLQFINCLTNHRWETRQVASHGLQVLVRELLSQNKSQNHKLFEYALLKQNCQTQKSDETLPSTSFEIIDQKIVDPSRVFSSMLTRVIIQMLKDQFKDFEDINMVVPVRAKGLLLIEQIRQLSLIEAGGVMNTLAESNAQKSQSHSNNLLQNIELLISNMPQFLAACENDQSSKLSFFMILRGLINLKVGDHKQDAERTSQGNLQQQQQRMFKIFAKGMIVESILKVEDPVKVVITQIIEDFLDLYYQYDIERFNSKEKQEKVADSLLVQKVLNNLTQALRQSDDIEGSVIFFFNLIYKIFSHSSFNFGMYSNFRFDCDVIFAFNFHKILRVRTTLHRLLNRFLTIRLEQSRGLKMQLIDNGDLQNLNSLIAQSIVMEHDSILVHLLYQNMKLVIQNLLIDPLGLKSRTDLLDEYVQYLQTQLLQPHAFQMWLYTRQMKKEFGSFEGFVFYESACFDDIDRNYWRLLYEPVLQHEIDRFYNKKLKSCVDVLAIIASETGLEMYMSQLLARAEHPCLLSNNGVIKDMFYCSVGKLKAESLSNILTFENWADISSSLGQICTESVNMTEHTSFIELEQAVDFCIKKTRAQQQLNQIFGALLNDLQNLIWHIRNQVYQLGQVAQPYPAKLYESGKLATLENEMRSALAYAKANVRVTQLLGQTLDNIPVFLARLEEDCSTQVAEMHRCLLIGMHLRQVRALNGQVQLHPKLNDLIKPLLKQVKLQKVEYFQRMIADIITNDLMTTLKQSNKPTAFDAILTMIVKGLAQFPLLIGDIVEEIDQDMTGNTEMKAWEMILTMLLSQDEPLKLFDPQFSKVIVNFIDTDISKKDFDFLQQYVNFLGRLSAALLLKLGKKSDRECLSIMLTPFLTSLYKIIKNLTYILRQQNDQFGYLQGVPEVNLRIFTILQLILTIESRDKSEDKFVMYLVSLQMTGLSNALRGCTKLSIETLNHMLQRCLQSMPQSIKQYVSLTQLEALPSYLFDTPPLCLQLYLPPGTAISDPNYLFGSLVYLPLFLLPTIMTLSQGAKLNMSSTCSPMSVLGKLIQLLPLARNNQRAAEQNARVGVQSEEAGGLSALQVRMEQLQAFDVKGKMGQNQEGEVENGDQGLSVINFVQESEEFLNLFSYQQIGKNTVDMKVRPNAELRDYQMQGIQWMIQLGRKGLNCALADEMGLGKTIQSLSVIINESYEQIERTKKRPVSLVICPNTLVYQWHKEVQKFFSHCDFKSMVFETQTSHKVQDAAMAGKVDLVITSYEKARSNIDVLKQFDQFFYIVLDEGHRIKNAKSKTTQTIKSLISQRKLLLSGTPLQNKVSELWSIFDFLMPQYLEEEKVFNQKYNQFLTSNLKKLSENLEETENFVQALKSLKKRIAPFILRRTKTEVLKDLPPKFIQDFECYMPEYQLRVHQYVERCFPTQQVVQGGASKAGGDDQAGVWNLQNLTTHRKVCNHPSFVLNDIEPMIQRERDAGLRKTIMEAVKKVKQQPILDNFYNSGKMNGLVDLLKQCQIIYDSENQQTNTKDEDGLLEFVENEQDEQNQDKRDDAAEIGHRALIFCQFKEFLNFIIQNILIPHNIKFDQIKSGMSPLQRVEAVERFNTDTSIKIMIMTTSVGGLGLNLTGADTVIFMEHSWNPMADLQAIDRAHRIGQQRTVNVYRLILQNTLEEQINSLQMFKKNLARNLIESNASAISVKDAENMQMHDLLGCFEEHTEVKKQVIGAARGGQNKAGNVKEFDESMDQRMEEDQAYMQELEDWVQGQGN